MWRSTKKETVRKENYPFASLGVRISEWKWGGFSKLIVMLEKRAKVIFKGYKGQSSWTGDAWQWLRELAPQIGEEQCGDKKMEEAIVDGRKFGYERERENNGWFWELDLKGKKERVSRVSKKFRVWFWEFNLNEEGR